MVAKLTALDSAIIGALHDDARQPLVQIARQLGQPESTIRHRLSRLVREGLVEFVALSDPLKIGYPLWVNIGLHVELPRILDVAAALDPFPEVYFVAITSGGFEIMISAVFRSNEELIEFITAKLAGIPGIRSSQTYHLLTVTKRRMGLLPALVTDNPPERSDKTATFAGTRRKSGRGVPKT